MSKKPDFTAPPSSPDDLTGRYIVTFREGQAQAGLQQLSTMVDGGIKSLSDQMDEEGADASTSHTYLPNLEMAIVTLSDNSVSSLSAEGGAILAIEPERVAYALALTTPKPAATENLVDDASSTWGLKAIGAMQSGYTGKGISLAVLDTGMDMAHPDFSNRVIIAKSFVPGETSQDGNGHGTHCVGTACGRVDENGRRYGVAQNARIYVGKVLSNAGSGSTGNIIKGMDWAIESGCEIISMSLGNLVSTSDFYYEAAGQRALKRGCLVIAASGNHGPGGTMGQPANSPSIMGIAALDSNLKVANFSARSGQAAGADVNVAAPGVGVYSSWPVNKGKYKSLNGTSMATPHVAGIAALYAEATGKRGLELWEALIKGAKKLPNSSPKEVGAGLSHLGNLAGGLDLPQDINTLLSSFSKKVQAKIADESFMGAHACLDLIPGNGLDPRVFAGNVISRLIKVYDSELGKGLTEEVALSVVSGAMKVAVKAMEMAFRGPLKPGSPDTYLADALKTALRAYKP